MESLTGTPLRGHELRGERLLLRRWQPDDAARVHAVMRDQTMFDFLTLPRPYTVQDADEFVTGMGHEGRDEGSGLGCAVVEVASGEVIGSAALRMVGYHPEIGFWIAPDARGRGYAVEATQLLTDFAFAAGLPRVGLCCDVRNLASARVALRAGFRFEGVLRNGAPVAARGIGDLACFGRVPGDVPGPVPPALAPLPADGLGDGIVTLRVLAPDDADRLHELDDDTTLAGGFGGERRTLADHRRIADRAGLDHLVGRATVFAIVDDGTGLLAGTLTLRHGGPPGVGGIGYVVHPAFRGRGYTARALRLLAPWAFGHGFARLELGAKVGNLASQRAALAAGFTPDGTRQARLRDPAGVFHDEARFALLAPAGSPVTPPRPGEVEDLHPGAAVE